MLQQRRGRFAGPPPRAHQHTSGLFSLQIHTSRVADCCEASLLSSSGGGGGGRGSGVYALTTQFLNDVTTEVRTVVGSSLFATIGRGNPSDVGEPAGMCTENPYFAMERGVAGTAAAASGTPPSYISFRLRAKDSRLSAALFLAVRKHSFVVLTDCRILLDSTTAAAVASEVDTTARMNMDEELYVATRSAMSNLPLAAAIEAAAAATSTTSSGAVVAAHDLQTVLQDHAAFLASIKYAAVYTEPGSGVASPFACLLLCLFDLRVTPEELVVLAKHHNRYLRAAALYFARYAYPLESLAAVFAPSMDDGTVIACSGDFSVTRSMAALAKMLLVDDDVDEAWLPTYSKWWQRVSVAPMVELLQAHRDASARAAASVRQQRQTGEIRMGEGGGVGGQNNKRGRDDDGVVTSSSASAATSALPDQSTKRGKSTLMGFRSALDFALFVDQARTLAASDKIQRLVASSGDGEDDEDDEEAAWARRHNNAASSEHAPPSTTSGSKVQEDSASVVGATSAPAAGRTGKQQVSAAGGTTSTANVHKIAASHAQRAIVELLGPDASRALRRGDPVYLSF